MNACIRRRFQLWAVRIYERTCTFINHSLSLIECNKREKHFFCPINFDWQLEQISIIDQK